MMFVLKIYVCTYYMSNSVISVIVLYTKDKLLLYCINSFKLYAPCYIPLEGLAYF